MGYYTQYTLESKQLDDTNRSVPQCEHAVPKEAAFCPACGRQIKSAPVSNAIRRFMEVNEDDYYGVLTDDTAKWYDYQTSMLTLSTQFPFHLFTLHGEGEEAGDLWTHYFLDGKSQIAKARIEYDVFDPAKLK